MEQQFDEQAPAPQLTPEQLEALRSAETELASDLKQAGEDAKARTGMVSADLLKIIEETERKGFVQQMVQADLSRELFAQDARLARVFAVSGAFSDIKGTSPAQAIAAAMTKIRMGRSWGLNEADSMQFIYFTNGRPAVMNELIASKLKDAGWDWDIRWHQAPNGSCIGCTLYPKRMSRAAGTYEYLQEIDPANPDKMRRVEVSFTKVDADAALIWEKGKQIPLSMKWNFKSWAQDMYFWRCIGRLKRRYAPNILRGAVTVDEAEEITDQPDYRLPEGVHTGTQRAAESVAGQKIAEMEHGKRVSVEEAEQRFEEREAEAIQRQQHENGHQQANDRPAPANAAPPGSDTGDPMPAAAGPVRTKPVFGRPQK